MFRSIAASGFPAVGVGARALLKLERPAHAPLSPRQLARDAAVPQGTDTVTLRGHALTVRTYGVRGAPPIVVSSGDGGWIHLGPHVGESLAAYGYFVVNGSSTPRASRSGSESSTPRTIASATTWASWIGGCSTRWPG